MYNCRDWECCVKKYISYVLKLQYPKIKNPKIKELVILYITFWHTFDIYVTFSLFNCNGRNALNSEIIRNVIMLIVRNSKDFLMKLYY